MKTKATLYFKILLAYLSLCKGDVQLGPDPWNYASDQPSAKLNEQDLPPDLSVPVIKVRQNDNKYVYGEWWFRRLLGIMLKSGQVKKSEDGNIDISLQMRFDGDKWIVLNDCLKSEESLTEVMFRRAIGYVEEAIYKPTITEKIVVAWTDYIQAYLIEYKNYLTFVFGSLAAIGTTIWLWNHMSHRHVIIIVLVLLYIYEVIISYKEAEKQEFQQFISAMNSCKWYFWTSECSIPTPDPILFMRHMNPVNIGIRMVTSFISEPIIAINSTIKLLIQNVTDGLWFPVNVILSVFLAIVINISLIYLFIMMIFNFIFNIPFNFNLFGIIGIGVRNNRRDVFSTGDIQNQQQIQYGDRISGERLDRILNVCSLALNTAQNRPNRDIHITRPSSGNIPQIKRSASTGRLPDCISNNNDLLALNSNLRRRKNVEFGDGDH